MPRAFRYCTVILLALVAVSAARRPDNDQQDIEPGPQAREDPADAAIYEALRQVINQGADVYNSNDHAGCYRIYEGSLLTIKPLLGHRPELQKMIAKALDAADADPVVWRRAFTLRAALDKARAELNPKKGKDDKIKDKPKQGNEDK